MGLHVDTDAANGDIGLGDCNVMLKEFSVTVSVVVFLCDSGTTCLRFRHCEGRVPNTIHVALACSLLTPMDRVTHCEGLGLVFTITLLSDRPFLKFAVIG